MNRLHKFLAPVALGTLLFAASAAQCQFLYQDITDFVGNFDFGNGEWGNQVSLPGQFGSYMITKFTFQFDFTGKPPALHIDNLASNTVQISWAATSPNSLLFSATNLTPPIPWRVVTNQPPETNGLFYVEIAATNSRQFFLLSPAANGNEMADLRFYRNDGNPVYPSSNTAPGTLIYDSGDFSIGGYTEASLVTFRQADLFGGVVVPQDFTWTVAFSGLTPNENAGLALYEAPTIGTNFNAAWIQNAETWQFFKADFESPAPNFGAEAYGTPLPQLQTSSQDGALVLSWPATVTGFTVETTTNLLPPINWVTLTNISVVNGQNVFSNAASGDGAYFRLVNTNLPAF